MDKKRKTRSGTSKTQKVLDHLKKRGTITSWEAINLYGATRLSAIIFNLRKYYDIQSVDIIGSDRYGNTSTYTKYVFCGEMGA